MRLKLPRVEARSQSQRCGSGGNSSQSVVLLSDATLVAPVWPNNFGETLLGTFHALHAQPPTGTLLLAISDSLRARSKSDRSTGRPSAWNQYARHFSELLELTWPGAAMHTLERGTRFGIDRLRVCHLHDAFDGGRRAFQGLQPSVLGATARQQALHLPLHQRPRWPVHVGLHEPTPERGTPGRKLHNVDELLERCQRHWAPHVTCETVRLDHAGVRANLKAVLPLHALVGLHGAHITYAAFAARPFALLEVRPWTMSHAWFRKYHQTAFALDTWTYNFVAGEAEHRKSKSHEPQRQGAILPVEVFDEFLANIIERFANHSKAVSATSWLATPKMLARKALRWSPPAPHPQTGHR